MSRQPIAGPPPTFLDWLKTISALHRLPFCECEDCAQDACLSLSESHPDWPPDDPKTQAWLEAVVRNKARDFHRRSRRNRVQSLEDLSHIPFAWKTQGSPEVDDPDRDEARRAKLDPLLSRLSDQNREIFVERVQHGRTFREIGESLNLPPAQVKARYFRTLKKLRKQATIHARDRDCNYGGGGLIAWWR